MIKKFEIFKDLSLYRWGAPFKTGAVTAALPVTSVPCDGPPFFKASRDGNNIVLEYSFADGDRLFGLGHSPGPMDRRGKRYRLYATDDPNHTPDKESLYGVHPFAFIRGTSPFGFFIDHPSATVIDAGYTDIGTLRITVNSMDLDIYIFTHSDPAAMIRDYLRLTGRPYVPPKWAFGYQQCRWSYPDRASVEEVAEGFEKNDIPCDAIYLDIDYMKDYKVFTVDEKRFPGIDGLASNLKERGIRLIAIIDPGVKIEKGYDVYEEGVAKGYFCKDSKGGLFTGAVWPGLTHFPDFLNAGARKWWGSLYERITKLGIEGFWNDMNEPAIFFTPEKLDDAFEFAKTAGRLDMPPGDRLNALRKKLDDACDVKEFYKEFCHTPEGLEPVLHEKVHNLYSFNMALAAEEGLEKAFPGKRHFLLSRSSFAGSHRYTAVWTGDNASWWEHLAVHMRMIMSLNMCGFLYSGVDIGGFGHNATADLLIRWTQLGALTPLFRNHSAMGTRRQEPWAFDERTTRTVRNIVRLRYALNPYLYSEFMRSARELTPFISPLFLKYGDRISASTDDQFMAGGSLMAAPVHAQNAAGRHVHLPGHKWLLWRASDAERREMTVMEPGAHYVEARLEEIPLFIAENSIIVLDPDAANARKTGVGGRPVAVAFVTKKASFAYYDDDGETRGFEKGEYSEIIINIENEGGSFKTSASRRGRLEFTAGVKTMDLEIYDGNGKMTAMSVAVE